MSPLSSVEPSSTAINSKSVNDCLSTLLIAAANERPALYTGITTDIAGAELLTWKLACRDH